jgi:hypothetical protein
MHRLRCLLVIGAVAAVVSVVAAGPAVAAKGGNNDTAKACQHGGWKAFGTLFANQGDCVNDGAQAKLGSAGSTTCQQIGGSFNFRRNAWICLYTPTTPPPAAPMDQNTVLLKNACSTDSGGQGTFEPFSEPTSSNPNAWLAQCLF